MWGYKSKVVGMNIGRYKADEGEMNIARYEICCYFSHILFFNKIRGKYYFLVIELEIINLYLYFMIY